ncbi:MAG TPA: transporter [Gammaproteobacteria bacterium]|nr:transporter [Gammaproteobacteria bacterium]
MLRRLLLLTLFTGVAGPLAAAPITFNTALPVATGEFVFREQGVLLQSGNDPGPADRDRSERTAVTALGYGLARRLALFGVLPYRSIRLKLSSGDRRLNRNSEGIGDLRLFGRYTLWQANRPGRTLRFAPFFGVEAPTGEDRERDGQGTLPPAAQPGSGSWDPFAGAVVTFQTLRYQIDAQLAYQDNRKANDFEAGDLARLDASLQYRLWPGSLGGGVPDYLYGVIESNLFYRRKDRVAGLSDRNSGGSQWFLSPGLQYVTRRWIVEAAAQIPVWQDLNGTALENDYILRAGVRVNF